MTHEHTAQTHTYPSDDWLSWARRPGFHPAKLVTVVAGLAIFPPLGVAALLYFLWANKRWGWSHNGDGVNRAYGTCRHGGHRGWHRHGRMGGRTGNMAFDAHRAEVLKKLDEEREAFQAYRAAERAKRDKAHFDAFRATQEQDAAKTTSPAGDNA